MKLAHLCRPMPTCRAGTPLTIKVGSLAEIAYPLLTVGLLLISPTEIVCIHQQQQRVHGCQSACLLSCRLNFVSMVRTTMELMIVVSKWDAFHFYTLPNFFNIMFASLLRMLRSKHS